MKRLKSEWQLHVMLLPSILLLIVFAYLPMAGISIAFQQFNPAKGLFGDHPFVGLDNFRYMFSMPNIGQVFWNTLSIALMKIVAGTLVPITVALMLNEITRPGFKRVSQTLLYFPYFLSWIVLSGVLIDLLSPSEGIVNAIITFFGGKPIYFLGDDRYFPATMVVTDVWKNFGFNTVVYLAAITGIDPVLYESASIDGAGRLRQTYHITLPGMRMIIVLMMVLNLGNLLNAGFDQIFNMYSPLVYQSGDIIDTLVYRMGLEQAQFSLSTATGLLKSAVSCLLISSSYYIAYKWFDYRIF